MPRPSSLWAGCLLRFITCCVVFDIDPEFDSTAEEWWLVIPPTSRLTRTSLTTTCLWKMRSTEYIAYVGSRTCSEPRSRCAIPQVSELFSEDAATRGALSAGAMTAGIAVTPGEPDPQLKCKTARALSPSGLFRFGFVPRATSSRTGLRGAGRRSRSRSRRRRREASSSRSVALLVRSIWRWRILLHSALPRFSEYSLLSTGLPVSASPKPSTGTRSANRRPLVDNEHATAALPFNKVACTSFVARARRCSHFGRPART